MLVAILIHPDVLCAGYATTRVSGLAKGGGAPIIWPAAGLAVTALVGSWTGLLGLPAPIAGGLVLASSATGIGFLVIDRARLWRDGCTSVGEHRLAAALLSAAIVVPMVTMGVALAGLQAPLSPHDGAFHVETSDAFRRGAGLLTWYPPGLSALFGAMLQLVPWLDTATGVHELGMGLVLLVPIAVFGLAMSVWHNPGAASAAALLSSLSHLFPYYPLVWGGWPQTIGIVLVIGLWVLATDFVNGPDKRIAGLAGLLVGAMVLVHGTELYTSAVVLMLVAFANWRRLPWHRLWVDSSTRAWIGLAPRRALPAGAAALGWCWGCLRRRI